MTLTFDEAHVPVSVEVRDVQLFMKRIRRAVEPALVRFFAVGEYGDKSGRPHYHLLLFLNAVIDHSEFEVKVKACWPDGFVYLGEVTEQSCGYVVGYTLKGMTKLEDQRLAGRKPEFARMSLRPGIGAGSVSDMARITRSVGGQKFVESTGDVPSVVRFSAKLWPLGRYLRARLRAEAGMAPTVPKVAARAYGLLKRSEALDSRAVKVRSVRREDDARRARFRVKLARSKKGV